MPQSGRTFRIFVSSTFSDLVAERNALQERVFPRLRELAMAHGCRFQAIDLRWGVSEEAALDQQTMRICLGEIERCRAVSPRPNFVILLGSRFGWRPLPYAIPADELDRLLPQVAPEAREKLLWREDQPAGEAGWYRRDDNAVPPEYVLLSRRPGSGYAEYDAWAKRVERPLVEALESAALRAELSAEAQEKYTLSATGQEIVKGALQTEDAGEHVFCFFREIQGLPAEAAGSGYLDAEPGAAERQAQLKARLKQHLPANVHEYAAAWSDSGPTLHHLDKLCDDVYLRLSTVMLDEIGRMEAVDPLEKESAAHMSFAAARARGFVGRADHLQNLAGYIAGREPWPLLIWGESGSGKSALMARALQAARQQQPQGAVVARFIGATPDSSNCRALLEDVCRQIARAYRGDDGAVPSAYRDLVQAFPKYLALASAAKPLILFLDALDQLSAQDRADELSWLPTALPASVRLVLSTLPGEAGASLAGRLPASARLEVKAMLPSEGAEALDGWLHEAGRRLTPMQRRDIVAKFSQGGGLPLHLKLAFEEARCWRGYDGLPVQTDGVQGAGADIPGVIHDLFTRLEQESNHGRTIVARALGYLAAAKNGLSEDELLDVLWADPALRSDFFRRSPKSPQQITALPVVAWSRLYLDLERYLAWRQADGTELLGFYHRQLRDATEARYCGPEDKPALHQRLAAYFGSPARPFWLDEQKSRPDRRKTAELAYQQASGGLPAELCDTLTTFEFLHARLAAGGTEALIGDYDLRPAPTQLGNGADRREGLRLIQGSLRLSAHILKLDTDQLPSQLLGRLQGFDLPEIGRLLGEARAFGGRRWLRPLTPCLLPPGGAAGRTLSGHTGAVTAVAALPDGRHAISASGDWSLKLWDLETGEVVRTFTGHAGSKKGDLVFRSGSVVDVAVLPDGGRILSASLDDTLKLWDLETGEATRTFTIHADSIRAVAVVPGGRCAVVACNYVHAFQLTLLDLETGEDRRLKSHTGQVTAVTALPDGRHAVSASSDGTIYLWDLESYEEIRTFTAHEERVNALAVLADGRRALSASEDTTLRLWDLETGAELRTFKGHSGSVSAVAVLPDGRHFLSASGYNRSKSIKGDNSLRLWGLDSDVPLRTFVGHTDSVEALAVVPGGRGAVSASLDGTLKVWDLPAVPEAVDETGTATHSFPGHDGQVDAVALLPDGQRLLTGSADRTIKLWDMTTGSLLRTFSGHGGKVNAIALLAGEKRFLSASGDMTVILWDLDTGAALRTFSGHTHGVSAVAVHSDGRRAVSASFDSTLKVWDLETGAELLTFRRHTFGVTSFEILPNGKGVLSFDTVHGPLLWDIRSGKEIRRFAWGKLMVMNGRLLPRGRQVLSFYHHNPKLWRLRNGKIFRELGGHTAPVTSVALLADGMRALSTSEDQSLKVWDLKTGRAIHTFTGHGGPVRAAALLPDGRRAISVSADHSLRLWDLDSGECLCSFHADGALRICAAGGDGRLMAGDPIGQLHFLCVEEKRPTAGRLSWLERLARLWGLRRPTADASHDSPLPAGRA